MTSLDDVVSVLGAAGYAVRPGGDPSILAEFEDAAVFGFVARYGSAAELLSRWKRDQETFIQRRVQNIRGAQEKRANLYAVFITSDVGKREEKRLVAAIEENFVASRKIVAAGVKSRQQLIDALLPLLPLQAFATISEANVDDRVQRRLQGHPSLLQTIAASDTPDMLVKLLVHE